MHQHSGRDPKDGAQQGSRQRNILVGVVQHPQQVQKRLDLRGIQQILPRIAAGRDAQAMQGIQTALSVANIFSGGAASSMIATIGTYIKALEGAMGSLNGVVKLLEDKMAKYEQADKAAAAVAENIEQAQWSEV